jgi:hypothetical protein
MTTIVETCNIALGRIGIDKLIEDINDPSPAARACKLHYEPVRRQLLADFAWNFAQGVAPLAELIVDPPPGWAYAYAYPANCLQAHVVTDAGGARLSAPRYGREIFAPEEWVMPRQPFEVRANPAADGQRMIVCDIAPAYLWFTVDVEAPTQMSPLFRSALAWRLAVELAAPLRAGPREVQRAEQAYALAVSQARVSSLGESAVDGRPESPSIMVRR